VKKILVIEDDRKIALALATRLKAAGYDTSLAYDAVTGVSSAMKLKPDLVLLDISLTPIIFITASKQPDLRKKAQELGAAGFFEKPYDSEELINSIQQALGQ
jgi:two-component system copper resistance phosphate regulon response regulator CusR